MNSDLETCQLARPEHYVLTQVDATCDPGCFFAAPGIAVLRVLKRTSNTAWGLKHSVNQSELSERPCQCNLCFVAFIVPVEHPIWLLAATSMVEDIVRASIDNGKMTRKWPLIKAAVQSSDRIRLRDSIAA